jgi:predicted PurR-regulated permease PerM
MSATLQRVLHRLDEQDVAISEIAPADHDRVVRYSLMGILTLLVMATLWVAQVITIPIVAGIIFGLVLGPTVDWLAEHGIPRVIAAALIGGLASMAVLSIAALIVTPVALMSDQLPAIVAALRAKLQIFLDIISRFEGTLTNGVTPAANEGVTAIPFMNIALSSSAVLSGFLIFVFTVFSWLATRRQLKARILRLCLGHNVRLSAAACFEDIEDRLATYFGVVTLINLVMGCICGAIAWWAGLSYPLFWAALGFVLNYLAFTGPLLVSVFLFGAGLLTSATGFGALLPAAIYYGIHLIEGNAVTPVAVGRGLDIPAFFVFASFVFWLWLWGPVGAILSTPILIVIAVARHALARYRLAELNQQHSE